MLRFSDKVVVVTGCGSIGPGWGNGKAISVLFARQGATVFGIDVLMTAAAETQRVIESEGYDCFIATGDVTQSADVERLIEGCLSQFGRINVLVNNVGQSEPGGPAEISEQTWDRQIELNLKSAFLTCKAALPIMERQGYGTIVNVASVAGLRYIGKPQVAYSASKAALMQFTKTTAVIYAAKGIRLNCVVPGLIDTPLVRRLADKYADGDYPGFVKHRQQQVPMGRMGDAWDVAHAALFLASDEAKYITATEIVVDGGLTSATK